MRAHKFLCVVNVTFSSTLSEPATAFLFSPVTVRSKTTWDNTFIDNILDCGDWWLCDLVRGESDCLVRQTGSFFLFLGSTENGVYKRGYFYNGLLPSLTKKYDRLVSHIRVQGIMQFYDWTSLSWVSY